MTLDPAALRAVADAATDLAAAIRNLDDEAEAEPRCECARRPRLSTSATSRRWTSP